MTILFLDFEWKFSKISKFLKKKEKTKVILAIDRKLLELSAEIITEKGWLGEHEVESLVRALSSQFEKKRGIFLKKLEKNFPGLKVELSNENLKDLLKKLGGNSDEIMVFIRKRGPFWGVVKPLLNEFSRIYKGKIKIVGL